MGERYSGECGLSSRVSRSSSPFSRLRIFKDGRAQRRGKSMLIYSTVSLAR